MARVRSRNTRPELRVRDLVFALGYPYRLHDISFAGAIDEILRQFLEEMRVVS
jgi:G:T-mismatch repair DNA endonuclease (very short patch repair protein)